MIKKKKKHMHLIPCRISGGSSPSSVGEWRRVEGEGKGVEDTGVGSWLCCNNQLHNVRAECSH